MDKEYRFDVFGRAVAVMREHSHWRAFYLGADGKRRSADFQIPDFIEDHELQQYLGDLFHESATPKRGEVRKISSSKPL